MIPDLELEDGSNYQIGKYGRMRQRYLFENHHAMYTHLVLTEKLWKHLEEVDMECNDMMDMLTVRMAEREGVTEHLKSVDQLGWVRKMNSIRSRAAIFIPINSNLLSSLYHSIERMHTISILPMNHITRNVRHRFQSSNPQK